MCLFRTLNFFAYVTVTLLWLKYDISFSIYRSPSLRSFIFSVKEMWFLNIYEKIVLKKNRMIHLFFKLNQWYKRYKINKEYRHMLITQRKVFAK